MDRGGKGDGEGPSRKRKTWEKGYLITCRESFRACQEGIGGGQIVNRTENKGLRMVRWAFLCVLMS